MKTIDTDKKIYIIHNISTNEFYEYDLWCRAHYTTDKLKAAKFTSEHVRDTVRFLNSYTSYKHEWILKDNDN